MHFAKPAKGKSDRIWNNKINRVVNPAVLILIKRTFPDNWQLHTTFLNSTAYSVEDTQIPRNATAYQLNDMKTFVTSGSKM